jgi:hypothetical protein
VAVCLRYVAFGYARKSRPGDDHLFVHFRETRRAITKGSAPLRAGIKNHEGEAENEREYPIERIPRDD